MDYCSRDEMNKMVLESQAKGIPTLELFAVMEKITRGMRQRHYFHADTDEAIAEAYLLLCKILPNIKTGKGESGFNYITTCVSNMFRSMFKDSARYDALKLRYKEELLKKMQVRNGKRKLKFKDD